MSDVGCSIIRSFEVLYTPEGIITIVNHVPRMGRQEMHSEFICPSKQKSLQKS